jgi:hypothetical protein
MDPLSMTVGPVTMTVGPVTMTVGPVTPNRSKRGLTPSP